RRLAGRVIGGVIVAGAVVAVIVTLLQWETRPQTDDATVRANFVGVAPQVSGHIVQLRVRDNQLVHEGELMFVVDPRPYEIALARARANLALTRKEVDSYRSGLSTPEADVAKARPPPSPGGGGRTRSLTPGRRTSCGAKRIRWPPMPRSPACKRSAPHRKRRCFGRSRISSTPRTTSRVSSSCCPRSSSRRTR